MDGISLLLRPAQSSAAAFYRITETGAVPVLDRATYCTVVGQLKVELGLSAREDPRLLPFRAVAFVMMSVSR